ncbi:hypothetical protein CEXT_341441 [Caerostris extrusa]|uniref:Uncharacterized protein n=1 Tax=Caerostris extrusa TaxID=172846 RepID=A0AAV4NE64_CAEEX|nr:hypothetical protein CEXT_341441 [Caerostris extrusa]
MSVNYFFRLSEFQTHLCDLFAVTLFRTPRGAESEARVETLLCEPMGKEKVNWEKNSPSGLNENSLSLSRLQREAADNIYRSTGNNVILNSAICCFILFFNAFCGNRLLERGGVFIQKHDMIVFIGALVRIKINPDQNECSERVSYSKTRIHLVSCRHPSSLLTATGMRRTRKRCGVLCDY